jgi:hypothetical protein
MNKNISNYNSKKQLHGYQETYRAIDKLYYRGNWKNNLRIGYLEISIDNKTIYYIK